MRCSRLPSYFLILACYCTVQHTFTDTDSSETIPSLKGSGLKKIINSQGSPPIPMPNFVFERNFFFQGHVNKRHSMDNRSQRCLLSNCGMLPGQADGKASKLYKYPSEFDDPFSLNFFD